MRSGLILVAVILIAISTTIIEADSIISDEHSIPLWAWSQALGNIRTILSWGPMAASANPALLTFESSQYFGLSGGTIYNDELTLTAVGATFASMGISFGTSIAYIGGSAPITMLRDPEKGISEWNRPYIDHYESHYAFWLDFGVAQRIIDNVSFGASLNIIGKKLPGQISGFGFSSNIGALWEINENFKVGSLIKDITTYNIFWDNGDHDIGYPEFHSGISYNLRIWENYKTVIYFEDNFAFDSGLSSPSLGTSITHDRYGSIALGFDGKNLCAGASANPGIFNIFTAVKFLGKLGPSYTFSLGYSTK